MIPAVVGERVFLRDFAMRMVSSFGPSRGNSGNSKWRRFAEADAEDAAAVHHKSLV
jgi:hypothetical protein